jgi:hypothetical protein
VRAWDAAEVSGFDALVTPLAIDSMMLQQKS